MQAICHWLWRLLPANPMVVRIVQGGSRRPRHLLVRCGYLGALILLVVLGLLGGSGMSENATMTELAKAGTAVFERIAYGQVILICLLAPLFMAGAIDAERSGKTYEILLSTPLSNMQIVLGSLFGRLFFILALLASGLPLFAVLLIFGGVPIRSVFVSFAIAGLTALVVGAVAVTLSTMRTGGRKAIFVFVIAVAAYLVASYTVDVLLLRRFNTIANTTTWLTPLHPLLVMEASLNSANYRPVDPDLLTGKPGWMVYYLSKPFATFAWLSAGLSLALVSFCALRIRAVGQGDGRFKVWLKRKLRLNRAGRPRPAREVWQNPIAWREANTRGKLASTIVARWAFTVIALVAAGWLLFLYHHNNLPVLRDAMGAPLPQHVVFRYAMQTLMLLEVAVIAMVAIYMSAGCISREREDGTLDLLLTTPITPKFYIWGKLRGLVSFLTLLLAAPVLTLAMASVYTMIGAAKQWPTARVGYASGQMTAQGDLIIPEAPILMALLLVPFVALCVAVGMSWSVKARGVIGAVVPSVIILGLASALLGFCGFSAAQNVPLVGPAINAFSPATNLIMILNPHEHVAEFMQNEAFGRLSLALAALIAAGGYGMIVYALLTGIVRNFDHTVRRLSGTG